MGDHLWTGKPRDVRILRQKIENSARRFCEFCATFQPVFLWYNCYDTSLLSRVSLLVGALKLRVIIIIIIIIKERFNVAFSK